MVEAQIAPSPSDPQPLTEEDIQEREQLLEQGFSNWNRRDFTSFIRACERYGRHAIPEITKEIEGKTEEEVCQPPASLGFVPLQMANCLLCAFDDNTVRNGTVRNDTVWNGHCRTQAWHWQ